MRDLEDEDEREPGGRAVKRELLDRPPPGCIFHRQITFHHQLRRTII
jgi:hypothetical protein